MKILLFAILFCPLASFATDTFPYSTRTKAYSGWSSNLRGDINSIGMGGATVAIPYSISAAQVNPAGFAMSTASLSAQIVKNTIYDGHLQKSNIDYESNQWGLGVTPSPWGFGILYYSPTSEGADYISPNTGQKYLTEISVKKIRALVARAFFQNTLSIGLSVGFAKAIRQLGPYSYGATTFDFALGALYRLPEHFLVGLSYIPQNTIRPSGDVYNQVDMPGFNQAIIAPTQIMMGLAWIPNRFFKTGFSLNFIASTDNTALLSDQNKDVGQYMTVQPSLGASYVIAEYENFKIEYAMGGYYEPTRIRGSSSRVHGTAGLEINPYFVNTGVGFDLSKDYRNIMISIGVDIVRTARFLGIVPKDPVPPYKGFLPPPTEVIADGLPQGITQGEESDAAPPNLGDVGKIIRDIPKRVAEKVGATSTPSKSKGRKSRAKNKKGLTP